MRRLQHRPTQQARELLRADRILIVKGRVDHKEGETKLVALEVAAFEAVAEKREVRLQIDATKARAGTIRELAAADPRLPRREPRLRRLPHLAGAARLRVRPAVPGASRRRTSTPR